MQSGLGLGRLENVFSISSAWGLCFSPAPLWLQAQTKNFPGMHIGGSHGNARSCRVESLTWGRNGSEQDTGSGCTLQPAVYII